MIIITSLLQMSDDMSTLVLTVFFTNVLGQTAFMTFPQEEHVSLKKKYP